MNHWTLQKIVLLFKTHPKLCFRDLPHPFHKKGGNKPHIHIDSMIYVTRRVIDLVTGEVQVTSDSRFKTMKRMYDCKGFLIIYKINGYLNKNCDNYFRLHHNFFIFIFIFYNTTLSEVKL